MADQLFISDQRMLLLMKWAIDKGIAESENVYLEQIGFNRRNLYKLRAGDIGFTKVHILKAAELTGANINWIYGLESNMLRQKSQSAIEQLQAAVIAVETELQKKTTSTRKRTQ